MRESLCNSDRYMHLDSKIDHQREYDPNHPYIPLEMFRIFPVRQERYFVGSGKSLRRFLFQGRGFNTLTQREQNQFNKFMQFLEEKKKSLPMDCIDDPFWTDSWKFRWLSSEDFDPHRTVQSIVRHTKYLQSNLTDPSQREIEHLKTGIFYICGRDAQYQPIMVFNVEKMIKSGMTEQELLSCQKFFFEKVMNHYLLPGQVETWVAIIDIGYQNLFSLIGPLKSSISFLSSTYRCRMKVAYLVKCPTSVTFLWSIIKAVMHEDTINKINFLKSSVVSPLLEYANPSQIEIQYGGTQPNCQTFWPLKTVPQVHSLDFSHKNVTNDFITKQAYHQMWLDDLLKEHIICNSLVNESDQPSQTLNNQGFLTHRTSALSDPLGAKSQESYIAMIQKNLLEEEQPYQSFAQCNLAVPAVISYFTAFDL